MTPIVASTLCFHLQPYITTTKFSLAATGLPCKRLAVNATPNQNVKKIPKASEVIIEEGPRPSQTLRRLPAAAPVVVTMYKVSDRVGDFIERFQDTDLPLWQVQVDHPAQRAITFAVRDSFNDFLAKSHVEDEAIPASLQELEQETGIRVVLTDRADPDGIGFIQWRVAFYIPGCLNNFLMLLDSFFQHKHETTSQDHPFQAPQLLKLLLTVMQKV